MSEQINKSEPDELEIQKRREAAMQHLRQHYIEAFEKHEPLFPQAEAELKQWQAQQAAANPRHHKTARRSVAKHPAKPSRRKIKSETQSP